VEDKVNYALVGIFVLGLGAALVVAVLWLAAGISTQKKYEPYQSIIKESVAGLSIAAPVKYLGVDVGKVSGIAIDPQNSRQVLLKFQIERGTPVKQDTEAVLKSQGLTGISYIELSGGSAGSAPLLATDEVPVPLIRSKPSLSARLEDVLTTVLANVNRTSANLDAVFDADNRAALKQVLADTASLAHALAAQQGTMTAGIADAARTARNAARISDRLGPVVERVAASADALAKMGNDVSRTSDSTGRTVESAASGVLQMRSETLPELQRLLAEMSLLAVSLRQLSEQTERSPSSLIRGAPQGRPGPGEQVRP
jgi:phospholipid/cholesterol/gamma-HCH transport system substrate-binding protein